MQSNTQARAMTRTEAEQLALTALGHIAADPDLLGRFLADTGIGPETLRQAASEPGFLAAVTGHLMANDAVMLAFAANHGVTPEDIVRAHAALSSGEPVDD